MMPTGAANPATLALVPKGPVTQKHLSEAVSTPTEKRGFVMPKFRGVVRLHCPAWFRGVVGPTRKDGRTASDVFLTTTLHPLRSKTQTVAFVTPEGAKTMTATNQGRIAPTFPATSATHDDDQQAAPLDLPAVPAWAIVHRACIQIWINRLPKAMRHIDPDECNACWRVCDVLADHADVHSALNEMHDAAALLAGAIGLLPAEFMDAHIALGKMAHLLDAAADVIDRASLRLFTEGGVA